MPTPRRLRPSRPARLSGAAALLLLLTACAGAPADDPERQAAAPTPAATAAGAPTGSATPAPASTPAPTGPTVVADGLEIPWGLAFLPGGDALVSERASGRVLRLPAGGGSPELVRTLDVRARGEGGLLGLAVSPDFARDGLVHAYFSTRRDNRVVRFPLAGGPVQEVLTGIPVAATHNGGQLVFGPDGHLYIGTGDAGEPSRAQDPDSLAGKVLRVTAAGAPVEGTRVFSSGHRNVQGLAFDDAGRLWATEFGQNRFDEVNQISRGDNGGWPEVEGPGTRDGRYAAPEVVWDPAEASPSGAAIVDGTLYVAALRGQRLWAVPLQGESAGTPRAMLTGELGRLRGAARAPDGSLWITTSNRDGRGDPMPGDDKVLRLTV